MKKQNDKSATKEFKKAKTKKKKPATKQPYTGGGYICRKPGAWSPNPNWKEQW
jgi:hypothetical protein